MINSNVGFDSHFSLQSERYGNFIEWLRSARQSDRLLLRMFLLCAICVTAMFRLIVAKVKRLYEQAIDIEYPQLTNQFKTDYAILVLINLTLPPQVEHAQLDPIGNG